MQQVVGDRLVAEAYNWRGPNRNLTVQDSTRSVAGHLRELDLCPRAPCEYHAKTMFVLLRERSRSNITEELRKFIAVHRREAVKMGDLLPSQTQRRPGKHSSTCTSVSARMTSHWVEANEGYKHMQSHGKARSWSTPSTRRAFGEIQKTTRMGKQQS